MAKRKMRELKKTIFISIDNRIGNEIKRVVADMVLGTQPFNNRYPTIIEIIREEMDKQPSLKKALREGYTIKNITFDKEEFDECGRCNIYFDLVHEDSMRRVFDDEVEALQKRAADFGVELVVRDKK